MTATAARTWSSAVRALWAQGGRAKVAQAAGDAAALARALELGLCRRLRGRWEITPLGLAWCEGRVRAVHRPALHFEATWLGGIACLSRKAPRHVAVAEAVRPIRQGQVYRLPSGRCAMVESLWEWASITCIYVPRGIRAERVCLRLDYFLANATRVPWPQSEHRRGLSQMSQMSQGPGS